MNLSKSERISYSELLWNDFKVKAEKEWNEKYQDYGEGINNVKVTTKFSQALCSDMKSYMTENNLKYKVPYHLTIDKYWKQDGFPENVQEASLDVFSIYLGYSDWNNFTKTREILVKKEQKIAEKSLPVAPPANNNRKNALLFFLGVGVISLLFFAFNSENTLDEKSIIEQVVKESIAAEFGAYATIPDTTTALSLIDSFFVKDRSAYTDVTSRVRKITSRNWILNNANNPSTADLLTIETESIEENHAYVNTKEFWLIKWFDTNNDGYIYQYRVTNEQAYILQKNENGIWKVLSNTYQAGVGKELPTEFKRADFDTEMTATDLNKTTRIFIQEGSLDAALWNISLYTSLHKLPVENDISILQGRYNNLVREWNLEKISREKFTNEKEAIALKILSVTEEL